MFAAVQRLRKLEEATNGNDEPTPGSWRHDRCQVLVPNTPPDCQHACESGTHVLAVYLLDEVFQMAQGGIQEVGAIVQFVVTRLTAKPPVVKQKASHGRPPHPPQVGLSCC